MTALADLLAAPPVLFTIALGLFLLLVRSPWPWTRVGGGFAAVAALALLAAAAADPGARARLFHPERLPVLVLVAASAGALWTALHQALHAPRGRRGERTAWRGPSSAEKLAGGVVVVLAALAAFALGAPLSAMADPGGGGGAAPWLLIGLEALRGYFDPWVGAVLVPLLTVVGLVALPYLDVPAETPSANTLDERRGVVLFFVFVWFLLALLPMAAAAFLRPETVATPPDLARSLSELVWSGLVEPPPRAPWLRELPAFVVLGIYFGVLPWQLSRWALFGRYLRRLGPRRFYAAMAMAGLWLLIPLKMYGRWLLGIGYFLDLPELSLRF